MIGIFKNCRGTVILLLVIFGCGQPALANGWEHTSIRLEVLLAALEDPNPDLRRRAAESLGYRRQPEAVAALIARLEKNEPQPRVRAEIFAALGKIGAPAALDAIQGCLDNEAQVAVRLECAAALGNIDSPRAEALALAGLGDAANAVRLRAIASLGAFSGTATVEALSALSRDRDRSIRQAALLALGSTRAAPATPVLLDALQNSPDREHLLVTLRALIRFASPAASTAIKRVFERSGDEEIRRHALVAMAYSDAAGAGPYFLDALASADPATRMLGLAVLRNFGDAGQAGAIVRYAWDDSAELFTADAAPLLRDPQQAIAALQLLNGYLDTIVHLDPAAGERLFLRAARAPAIPRGSSAELKIAQQFYQARWQALYGLGYCDSAAAARTLAAALADPDARIRAVALRSLGVSGRTENIDAIASRLGDGAAEVRWMAARVLGRLEAADSSASLVAVLGDPHAQVRLEAATALGYLGAREARAELARLAAQDPDARVRAAASYAASLLR